MFSVASEVFSACVKLLALANYREMILTGVVVSAGGLGESLVLLLLFLG